MTANNIESWIAERRFQRLGVHKKGLSKPVHAATAWVGTSTHYAPASTHQTSRFLARHRVTASTELKEHPECAGIRNLRLNMHLLKAAIPVPNACHSTTQAAQYMGPPYGPPLLPSIISSRAMPPRNPAPPAAIMLPDP